MSTARTTPILTAPTPPTSLVGEELQLVERRLAELLRSREARLTDIAAYLIGAGGKRVRPAVTLLVFRACGGTSVRDIVDVAVALELIHSASLLHDDIIDDTQVRRGRDSARRKYGVAQTLVTGDFLFSRAFQICGRFDEQLIEWAAEACVALTEGEIMQSRFRRNPAVTFTDYLEIIARKTASLFEVGARTAAVPGRRRRSGRRGDGALRSSRRHDLSDDRRSARRHRPSKRRSAKPIGLDVREGNPSLPLVLAIAEDDDVRRLFAQPELSDAEVGRRPGAAAPFAAHRARPRAGPRARRAGAHALHVLPDSPYRQYLLSLIDQLVDRTF